ncbi:hypothetical protein B0H17DRAFT_1113452 [Mycena rosella]|uniref:Uncharacterized protein n=1 Tax=Mycena rosella TaxID=1033263 RepID=A0AAD7BH37_MYCRO|nr:hypothetical protein B0H17DRAFT_1113452 [Mycena rosella]
MPPPPLVRRDVHVDCLGRRADRRWLAGANLQQPMGVILGDPYADRLNFTLSTEGITFPPILMELLQDFLEALSDVVQRASEEDVVVLVICAHGQPGGDISLRHLRVPRERVFIVSTACYSGSWRSPRWTLLAAAEEDQESDAMRESGSNECRGGFFTFAILAEMVDEQGLAVPLCEELGLGEGELGEADRLQFAFTDSFDVGAATPRRSLVEAKKFMEQFRDRVGGIYKFTTFVMDPASHLPLEFPVRFFDSTFLDRFHIQRALLSRLRYHARACRRAAAIAAFLKWTPAEPVTKWNKKTGLTRINEAERAGVKIRESFVDDTADGAWVWLAETWGDALSCGDESAGKS